MPWLEVISGPTDIQCQRGYASVWQYPAGTGRWRADEHGHQIAEDDDQRHVVLETIGKGGEKGADIHWRYFRDDKAAERRSWD
ncbi:hypothetical protein SACS_1842 [Parasaccharibacter apium]|uniref:Uncharacterized protein n=1 Tax=Parasaccharibacter apium TaxID=1510841 RepID=A0A7U7G3Y3_9PROT|nr:hypothetical protein SACS_1842 [Parasaccharibacter apium]